ncbi:MAG: PH domain-containing protein [Alphaproteobacteria bacterium]
MNGHTWLLVCTSKRVLFLDRGFFYGLRQVQMNLDRIQAIESSTGLLFGAVRMWDSASSVTVSMILRSSLVPFVRTVQEAMELYKRYLMADMVASGVNVANIPHLAAQPRTDAPPPQAPSPQPPASHLPWVGELERLTKMKADGQLTDQEFSVAKAKLLSGT